MSQMVKVCFIKAGTPHGYGYSAGEFGTVKKEDFEDTKFKDKQGNDLVKKGLQSLGVVRQATDKEYTEALGVVAAATAAKRAPKKGGGKKAKADDSAAEEGAEGAESDNPDQ